MKHHRVIITLTCLLWLYGGFSLSAQTGASLEQDVQSGTPQSGTAAAQPATTGSTPLTGNAPIDPVANLMLARSSADYRVTPGDVYTLAYAAGSTPVSYIITVDASYRIRVSNLGIINGANKTFMQLKNEVEATVARNYPLSGVQLVLTQPAVFRVYLTGEVYTAGEVSAWGLSRLSSFVNTTVLPSVRTPSQHAAAPVQQTTSPSPTSGITPYASIRDITIKSADGRTTVYDLFTAQRSADLTQDPYLRPGDVITFNRIKRVVTVTGAVERPGRYQLLDGEQLQALLTHYGNGLTPLADHTRSTLTRYVGSAEISGDVTVLTAAELASDYPLQDMDTVTIPAISTFRPAASVNRLERSISISGAVRRPGTYELLPGENLRELIEVYADGFTAIADSTRMELVRLTHSADIAGDKVFLSATDVAGNYQLEHYDAVVVPSIVQLQSVMFVEGAIGIDVSAELTTTNRVVIQYAAGETYASLVRNHIDWFTAVSDTENAYIVRAGERIGMNLNPLLYDAGYRGEVLVEENDVLVVPFRQYFVTVAGAVTNPGRYPYIPDRDWEYYVGLAGGFIADRNMFETVVIRDKSGKRQLKTSVIEPETMITANSNHFLFFMNQWAPVITTVLTIITSAITIQTFLTR